MNTIIEVNQGNYTERIIMTAKNFWNVLAEIEGKAFQYIVKGDFVATTQKMSEKDEYCYTLTLQVKGDKVKILDDVCDAYIPKFQKIKTTSKGQYITHGSDRVYFLNGFELDS